MVSIGIPKNSVLKDDVALKTGKYVPIAHETLQALETVKNIIAETKQGHYAVYDQSVHV
jgi:hypothetical protein